MDFAKFPQEWEKQNPGRVAATFQSCLGCVNYNNNINAMVKKELLPIKILIEIIIQFILIYELIF